MKMGLRDPKNFIIWNVALMDFDQPVNKGNEGNAGTPGLKSRVLPTYFGHESEIQTMFARVDRTPKMGQVGCANSVC